MSPAGSQASWPPGSARSRSMSLDSVYYGPLTPGGTRIDRMDPGAMDLPAGVSSWRSLGHKDLGIATKRRCPPPKGFHTQINFEPSGITPVKGCDTSRDRYGSYDRPRIKLSNARKQVTNPITHEGGARVQRSDAVSNVSDDSNPTSFMGHAKRIGYDANGPTDPITHRHVEDVGQLHFDRCEWLGPAKSRGLCPEKDVTDPIMHSNMEGTFLDRKRLRGPGEYAMPTMSALWGPQLWELYKGGGEDDDCVSEAAFSIASSAKPAPSEAGSAARLTSRDPAQLRWSSQARARARSEDGRSDPGRSDPGEMLALRSTRSSAPKGVPSPGSAAGSELRALPGPGSAAGSVAKALSGPGSAAGSELKAPSVPGSAANVPPATPPLTGRPRSGSIASLASSASRGSVPRGPFSQASSAKRGSSNALWRA